MASITRIMIAAAVFGVFLTASISTLASPGEPTFPAKTHSWVAPDMLFPLRKLDPGCTGRPPVAVSLASSSRCTDDWRQPHVVGRHGFDTNA